MIKSMASNLMVNDVAKTVEFYEKILGFTVSDTVPNDNGSLDFAIILKDNFQLMFQEKDNLAKEYPILKAEILAPSITVYIIVDNFDDVYKDIKSKIDLYVDKHTTFYGAEEFAVQDCNGYVITFAKSTDN